MQIYLTGHSLGGAMATLASYDIHQAMQEQHAPVEITCYTFGSPRTGNHAFARDVSAAVPDAWSIINDQVSKQRPTSMLVASLL